MGGALRQASVRALPIRRRPQPGQ